MADADEVGIDMGMGHPNTMSEYLQNLDDPFEQDIARVKAVDSILTQIRDVWSLNFDYIDTDDRRILLHSSTTTGATAQVGTVIVLPAEIILEEIEGRVQFTSIAAEADMNLESTPLFVFEVISTPTGMPLVPGKRYAELIGYQSVSDDDSWLPMGYQASLRDNITLLSLHPQIGRRFKPEAPAGNPPPDIPPLPPPAALEKMLRETKMSATETAAHTKLMDTAHMFQDKNMVNVLAFDEPHPPVDEDAFAPRGQFNLNRLTSNVQRAIDGIPSTGQTDIFAKGKRVTNHEALAIVSLDFHPSTGYDLSRISPNKSLSLSSTDQVSAFVAEAVYPFVRELFGARTATAFVQCVSDMKSALRLPQPDGPFLMASLSHVASTASPVPPGTPNPFQYVVEGPWKISPQNPFITKARQQHTDAATAKTDERLAKLEQSKANLHSGSRSNPTGSPNPKTPSKGPAPPKSPHVFPNEADYKRERSLWSHGSPPYIRPAFVAVLPTFGDQVCRAFLAGKMTNNKCPFPSCKRKHAYPPEADTPDKKLAFKTYFLSEPRKI